MTPALRFFLAWIAVLAGVDAMFWLGVFPGGTITQGVEGLHAAMPWLPWAYLGLCLFGLWHFFGPRRKKGHDEFRANQFDAG